MTVRDRAGNALTGAPARFRITSVTSQRLRAEGSAGRPRAGEVRPPGDHPRPARCSRAAARSDGIPITVTTTPRGGGRGPVRWRRRGRSGANGRFVVRLRRAGTRRAHGTRGARPAGCPPSAACSFAVPASSDDRGLAPAPGRPRARSASRGRVRGGAGGEPRRRSAGEGGRPVADVRGHAHGAGAGAGRRAIASAGAAGDYPIRVRVRRQGEPAVRDGPLAGGST